jgi:hypothetical protein
MRRPARTSQGGEGDKLNVVRHVAAIVGVVRSDRHNIAGKAYQGQGDMELATLLD